MHERVALAESSSFTIKLILILIMKRLGLGMMGSDDAIQSPRVMETWPNREDECHAWEWSCAGAVREGGLDDEAEHCTLTMSQRTAWWFNVNVQKDVYAKVVMQWKCRESSSTMKIRRSWMTIAKNDSTWWFYKDLYANVVMQWKCESSSTMKIRRSWMTIAKNDSTWWFIVAV
jgi:hypothetical protein